MTIRNLLLVLSGLVLGTALGFVLTVEVQSHLSRSKAALMYAAGNRMLEQGEIDAALVQFAQAIFVDPQLCSAYTSVGDVFIKEDKRRAGKQYYMTARKCFNAADPHTLMDLTQPEIQRERDRVDGVLRRLEPPSQ